MSEECILVAILLYILVETDREEKIAFDCKIKSLKVIVRIFRPHISRTFPVGILLVLIAQGTIG